MADREQVKPLAFPSPSVVDVEDDEALSRELKLKKRKYIGCCGCLAAVTVIVAVVIIVLFFTVFRVQNPKVRFNSATLESLQSFGNGNLSTNLDRNITLIADVSVKNPNVATFKFEDSTTFVYYGGSVIGEGTNPGGEAKARSTLRRNVTVDIVPEKVLGVPSFASDYASGALKISSYTSISGRVNMLGIKRNMVVRFNCSMTYRPSGQDFHGDTCMPEVIDL